MAEESPISTGELMVLAMKVKTTMIKKNKTRAWTKCPKCGGRIITILAGPRNHIHMQCETKDCITIME